MSMRPGEGGRELDFGEMRELTPTVHGDVHRVDECLRRRRKRKASPPVPRHGPGHLRMHAPMKHVSGDRGVERSALPRHGDVNLSRNLGEHSVQVERE